MHPRAAVDMAPTLEPRVMRRRRPCLMPGTRTRTKRLPDGTMLRVTTTGTRKPHRHKWNRNPGGTVRTCATCDVRQTKTRGRWTDGKADQ